MPLPACAALLNETDSGEKIRSVRLSDLQLRVYNAHCTKITHKFLASQESNPESSPGFITSGAVMYLSLM